MEDQGNEALDATKMYGLSVCWCCGRPGHLKAFCTAKLIHGKEADQLNVSFVAIGNDYNDEYLTQVSDSEP